ncbi:ribosome maturation factor RimM [Enterobacteriaceae endosymbiont of Donacia sparganii]|uniref:ribosome maturation factor RimM n=1 Tax=Enterobacteriaceae endosymbiont of Donacia sparganii TaxID=2675785 RepID=UPI0014490911|nr:ribosome maturation factor RimM [Enterobacteriaceae endosymbiont of Donacia sparganii]QJC35866.1 16S rRNA processing protein RimM [Enterobacteriaceae endosymbiont of Donacia sparganii]
MNILKEKIILGKFGKIYGIKGWIRLFSYTQNKNNIFLYKKLFILNNIRNIVFIKFNQFKVKKNYFIVKINNLNKNEDTIKFINHQIYIFKYELIKYKNKKEYYWIDIIGCHILNKHKIYLGKVINIIETKIYDILIIKSNNLFKKKIIFIPFIEPNIIRKIDLIHNIIKVNWNL